MRPNSTSRLREARATRRRVPSRKARQAHRSPARVSFRNSAQQPARPRREEEGWQGTAEATERGTWTLRKAPALFGAEAEIANRICREKPAEGATPARERSVNSSRFTQPAARVEFRPTGRFDGRNLCPFNSLR